VSNNDEFLSNAMADWDAVRKDIRGDTSGHNLIAALLVIAARLEEFSRCLDAAADNMVEPAKEASPNG